jgi:hypothetical protein
MFNYLWLSVHGRMCVCVSVYTALSTGFTWIDYKGSALRRHIAFALLNKNECCSQPTKYNIQ